MIEEKQQAAVIPFNRPADPDPKCSFCRKPKSACARFISNHDETRHICGDCIKHAKARMEEAA